MSITTALQNQRARLEENQKGFTLIELLVVVLIIGILAAIAIPVFLGQQDAARDSAVESDLANAKIAVISYQVANPAAEDVDLDAATLGDFGFTNGEFTTFVTESVDVTAAWTIEATSSTGNTFQVTSTGGVVQVED